MSHEPSDRWSTFRVTALGTTAALAVVSVGATALAPAAMAADTNAVPPATARLVDTSLLAPSGDDLAALRGATAVTVDGGPPVTADVPLDTKALDSLLGLTVDGEKLFGNGGIIRLGDVAQYAQASGDGSAVAFSGTRSAAPSTVDSGSMTPSAVGDPADGASAAFAFGDDDVNFRISIGEFGATAERNAAGDQSSAFVLSDLTMVVGGATVKAVVDAARVEAGSIAWNLNQVSDGIVPNPFSEDGTVTLTLDDLVAAAGVSSVYDLSPATDLMDFVPAAVIAKITADRDLVMKEWQDNQGWVCRLNSRVCDINVLRWVFQDMRDIDAIVDQLPDTIGTPLGASIPPMAQLVVNVQATDADKVLTQTALRLGLGPDGSLASVDLASASVDSKVDIYAVPLVNGHSAVIAGSLAALGLGAWLAVAAARRRRTGLPAAA